MKVLQAWQHRSPAVSAMSAWAAFLLQLPLLQMQMACGLGYALIVCGHMK